MAEDKVPDISREALALEATGLSFVLTCTLGQPLYVSSQAQLLLGIDNAEQNPTVLKSLLHSLPLANTQPFTQEHHLRNSFGHTIAAKVHISAVSDGIKLIVLHPLNESLPLIETVERNQKLRPLLVFLAASLGPRDDLIRVTHRILDQSVISVQDLFPAISNRQSLTSDLQSAITRALSIADIFLPSTIKVVIDAKRPALINVDPSYAVRILTHTLLEAALFTAGCGEIRVRSVLGRGKKISEESSAEVVIVAERTKTTNHSDGNWLHQTLINRTQNQTRRVTVADEEPTMKQLQSGEGLVSGSLDPQREISRSQYSNSVPEGGESTDLFFARTLANTAGVTIQFTCPDTEVLACYLSFPLSTTDLATERG